LKKWRKSNGFAPFFMPPTCVQAAIVRFRRNRVESGAIADILP